MIKVVRFESDALGDNIAWLPYLEQYERENNVIVHANCYYQDLFGDVYPERYFQKIDSKDCDIKIGISDRELPLQKVACDCLGLQFKETRPRFNFSKLVKSEGKTITFSEFGSNHSRSWNNPYGWTQVIRYINSISYKPVAVSFESTDLTDIVDFTGRDLISVCNVIYSSDLYVGVSSGLAWLSWILNVPVVMIGGVTLPYFEFQEGNRRISALNFNNNICVGCYNNNSVSIEWDDKWCPFYKNTIREHECTYSISSSVVINAIKSALKK